MKKCKVVINTCYGGFGLSDEAVLWLEQNAKDEKVRTSQGDCKDWEEMEVNPEQFKDMIDKCLNIKSIE